MTQTRPIAAIELDGLSFRYLGSSVPALHDVTLQVAEGEMVVVMGATGAGKSTLAKCLNRTIPSFHSGDLEGRVRIFGADTTSRGVSDMAAQVGLVSQDFEAQLFATNVLQEVVFGMEQLGVEPAEMKDRVGLALTQVGLAGFEERDPSTLSGGEKQRLAIAASLALQPRILVFDEPTTDLDPLGKQEVFEVLAAMRARGYTILLIEHETTAAELADRLVLLDHGRIVADAPPPVLLRQPTLLDAHGVRTPDLYRLATALSLPGPVGHEEIVTRLRSRARRPEPTSTVSEVATAAPPLLRVEGAHYAYEEGRPALRGVSLRIYPGELVALIGQNGSGKTTLAKLLNGLLTPTQGHVFLRGTDLEGIPLSQVAADVGYVFQNPDHQIFAASVFDEVAFGPRNLGLAESEVAARVGEVLDVVDLAGLASEDPFVLGKGQRQRLAVASLLALRPKVLILDEPTTGLDYPEQRRMMDMILRLHHDGMTFVLITHSPWVVAEYARRGVLMRHGAIQFDGPLRDLFAQEELLAAARFRVPEVTRVGRELGRSALSVAELLGSFS